MRFGVVIVALIISSCGLIGGAMLWGRALGEPNHLPALGFDLCATRACYERIVPGVTPFDNALTNVRSTLRSDTRIDVTANVITLQNAADVTVVEGPVESAQPVEIVHLYRPSGRALAITLGQLIDLYGPPCNVSVTQFTEQTMGVALSYPSGLVVTIQVEQNLTPNTLLQSLTLEDTHEVCQTRDVPSVSPWTGFISQQRLTLIASK